MKKHVLALVLIGLVCFQAKETRACGELVIVGIVAAELTGLIVSAVYWAHFENDEAGIRGYSCRDYGVPITWYCCTANEYNQLNCNPLTIPCHQSTAMCYYGVQYGRQAWSIAGKIYTNDVAQKIAGLTASTIIFAVGFVGTVFGLAMCTI